MQKNAIRALFLINDLSGQSEENWLDHHTSNETDRQINQAKVWTFRPRSETEANDPKFDPDDAPSSPMA